MPADSIWIGFIVGYFVIALILQTFRREAPKARATIFKTSANQPWER